MKKYLQFMRESRQDYILDKILDQGIGSLTPDEKRFMDAHKSGNEKNIDKEISIRDGDLPLISDDSLFEFSMESVEEYKGDGMDVLGTLSYQGELYYGKFSFNEDDEIDYWMFEPVDNNIEHDTENDMDIYEFEYNLDENNHLSRFEDFCVKIYQYYIKGIEKHFK